MFEGGAEVFGEGVRVVSSASKVVVEFACVVDEVFGVTVCFPEAFDAADDGSPCYSWRVCAVRWDVEVEVHRF